MFQKHVGKKHGSYFDAIEAPTVGQRLHAVRTSPGAMEPIDSPAEPESDAREEANET